MRDRMLSILLLTLIICFVVINTIIVERQIDETILAVEKLCAARGREPFYKSKSDN